MFKNSIKQLFTCILITLFAMSCDGDSHTHGHDEDGLTVSGNDVAIAIIEVEGEEHEHDDEECPHATCVYGFQLEEEGQQSYTYRQLNLNIDGTISLAIGETKEFSVHFLDADGDELHEEEHCDEITEQAECESSEHCEWDANDSSCEEEEHCDEITDPTVCGNSDHCIWDSNDNLCEDEGHEEHGMHIEIEGVSAGTTTFQIELMHDGHSDFTSLPILVTVE